MSCVRFAEGIKINFYEFVHLKKAEKITQKYFRLSV